MGRNFTSEQQLIDHLHLDDSSAFEELYHRYCIPLYSYCLNKLGSPEDAKCITRDTFIDLWQNRHQLPVYFSISTHLYKDVRRRVIQTLNEKLEKEETAAFGESILPGFKLVNLKNARLPVWSASTQTRETEPAPAKKENYQHNWWNRYYPAMRLKSLRHALQHFANIW